MVARLRLGLLSLCLLGGCESTAVVDDAGAPPPDHDAGGGAFDAATPPAPDAATPPPPPDAGPEPTDAGPPPPNRYTCTAVGASGGDGVFSLASFGDHLYAGEFGYGRAGASMVSRFPSAEATSPGLLGVGESVCALEVFDGALYANTEDSGDIFRTVDGDHWERVYDGRDGSIGCGLEVFDGHLYAVSFDFRRMRDGRVLRTADGERFEEVWSSGSSAAYLREIAAHDGQLFALGTDAQTGQGFWLSSADGASWAYAGTPSRFFRAHSYDGALYFGATDRRSNGAAGVFRYAAGELALVHPVDTHYVTDLADWDGALFAGTSAGFKDDVGTSQLLLSRDGERWEPVCDFDEIAVWAVVVHDEHLWVGTWQFRSGGQVYRVDIDPDGRPRE